MISEPDPCDRISAPGSILRPPTYFLLNVLFECRIDLSISMLIVNTSGLVGVTHPFCRSPGNGTASITGHGQLGRRCSYADGTKGGCTKVEDCIAERRQHVPALLSCPYHRTEQICCPDRLPGEQNAFSVSEKIYGAVCFSSGPENG